MFDFQWKEKMRKIERSTMEKSQVPEQAKSVGFGCFTVGMLLVVLLFAFISIGLLVQKFWMSGVFSLIFTVGLAYISIQLIRADKLT